MYGETAGSKRIVALDTARGLAIVFMILAHTWVFVRESSPAVVNRGVSLLSTSASPLFALIIGLTLGFNLLAAGAWSGQARRGYQYSWAAKSTLLILLGLALTWRFSGAAIVLQHLGWSMLILTCLMFLSSRTLLITAGLTMIGGPFIAYLISQWRQASPQNLITYYGWPEPVRDILDWTFVDHNYRLTGLLPLMLLGIVLARRDFHRGRDAVQLGVAGVASVIFGYGLLKMQARGEISFKGSWGENFFDLGLALFISSLVFWAFSVNASLRRILTTLTKPISAQGSMALSIYTLHILLLVGVWSLEPLVGPGGALRSGFGSFDRPLGWAVVGGVLMLCALFALAWRAWVGIGPVEIVFAALTKWLRQPDPSDPITGEDRDLIPDPSD